MELKPGYKQTEVGVIPEDWSAPHLDALIEEISMGPFGSDITVSNFISAGIPVLNGRNVASERLKDCFENYVSPEKAKSLKKAVARRGDVVVTHRGTIGQISYIPENSTFDQYVVSQSQFRVRFKTKAVMPVWVVIYFHSSYGNRQLLDGKGHTGVPAIAQPTKTFRGLHVPLPPKIEQEAIAGALSDADTLIESLDQLIAKKRQIKQGAMQELLTGKRRLPGFSGEWIDVKLGDIADPLQGWSFTGGPFGSNLKSSDYTDEGVRIIQLQNIGDGYFQAESAIYTTKKKADELISCNIYPGEIILSKMGDPVARACLIPELHDRYLMCSDGIRLAVDKRRFNTFFVFAQINAPDFRARANNAGTGSTRKRIGLTELRSLRMS